jgi:hypothetical protein
LSTVKLTLEPFTGTDPSRTVTVITALSVPFATSQVLLVAGNTVGTTAFAPATSSRDNRKAITSIRRYAFDIMPPQGIPFFHQDINISIEKKRKKMAQIKK